MSRDQNYFVQKSVLVWGKMEIIMTPMVQLHYLNVQEAEKYIL